MVSEPGRYLELTLGIPTANMTSMYFAPTFVKHLVLLYGISNYLWTDIDPQLVSKFLATLCLLLPNFHIVHRHIKGQ